MNSELKERVLRELGKEEVLHIREIVSRIGVPISVLRPILNEMVEEGLLEKFSHGGYTFFRITSEGKSQLLRGNIEGSQKGSQEESLP